MSDKTFDKAIELLKEIIDSHSDKESCDYNECDVYPCQWCFEAGQAISALENIREQPKTAQTERICVICKELPAMHEPHDTCSICFDKE